MRLRLTHKALSQLAGPKVAAILIRKFGGHSLPTTGADLIERNQRIRERFDQTGDYDLCATEFRLDRSRIVRICAE